LVTAHELWRTAGAQPAAARGAYWALARQLVGRGIGAGAGFGAGGGGAGQPGPGALESALAQVALEWACLAAPPLTAMLFDHRPSAWVVVGAGGDDALAQALLAASQVPALHINTGVEFRRDEDVNQGDSGGGKGGNRGLRGPAGDDPFADAAMLPAPLLITADGLEAEAHAAATAVIQALDAGQTPVALVALDRVLMRRVRALLDRCRIGISDETGWTLSTTRAAARLMALLRAAQPGARHDDRLEWLKSNPAVQARARALQTLESIWRSGREPRAGDDASVVALLDQARSELSPLAQVPPRRSLSTWLQALAAVLASTGLGASLRDDAAGAQLLDALRLRSAKGAQLNTDAALTSALQAEVTDLAGFADWIDRTLETSTFLPPAAASAEVVVTPLARVMLRPFAAVVIAGADARHLGATSVSPGLIERSAALVLGLPAADFDARAHRERLALAQALRLPQVTFTMRRREGDEPVAPSPLLDAIALARQRAGSPPLRSAAANPALRQVAPTPILRPAPAAPAGLPGALSATSIEALRDCPYKFFARYVLQLREADELQREVDKRDYGNWLHAVLHRFHQRRGDAADDLPALLAAAQAVTIESGIDPAALLPLRAGFEQLVPAYLAWLQARDAAGLRWVDGERRLERDAAELGGPKLSGVIDRVDEGPLGIELIDYKTSAPAKFRSALRNRFEDTQLAFYALLVNADKADEGDDDSVKAAYLALDSAKAPEAIEHARVAESARALLEGLAEDLRRLRAGAGFAALGEAPVCDVCEARGLCRRDHWTSAP
jgi:ATP-dependent helicase/nuclease subunit B